ncbi:MAG TPA: MBOAT family O-acyltransferase [Candidatus Acidoferrum sp.]|nr:MBOAT family O-acyltransferase [Candidatus Acidoferrum sp.]
MVFASYSFLFIFLPIALFGYYVATKVGATTAVAWLTICSLAFYAWWNPKFVILLVASVAFNFAIGRALLSPKREDDSQSRNRLLFVGVLGNLLPLIFFKYLGPMLSFAHSISLISPRFDLKVILPLGISFFTFTQIGYLVDCHEGEGRELGIVHYSAFVTFFPHLIAGPILHIREIGPQLLDPDACRLRMSNMSIGTSFFIIGLSKKVLLADPLADVVGIGFAHPASFPMFTSWLYALAYSLQLYFDFSGYSDMAIGLAYMFGIRFPINFDSPYKSTNIIEYWQRWHITLTRYLTLLLYNPIALRVSRWRMRRGLATSRRDNQTLGAFASMIVLPVFFTFIIVGIWHGAGFQFLALGLMHAVYITINHAWRMFGPKPSKQERGWLAAASATTFKVLLTYLAVLAGQVMFRSSSVGAALQMFGGMIGLHGLDAFPVPGFVMSALRFLGPVHGFLTKTHHFMAVSSEDSVPGPASLALRFLIVWAFPNSQTIMAKFQPMLTKIGTSASRWLTWEPTLRWALVLGILLAFDLMSLQQTKVFLYFQF